MPARHLRHQIGRRGRNDDQIGFTRQADMADVVLGLDTNLVEEAKQTGLFEANGVDASAVKVPGGFSDDVFLPYDYGHFAVIYDTETVKNPPTSLKELVEGDPSPSGHGRLRIARGLDSTILNAIPRAVTEPWELRRDSAAMRTSRPLTFISSADLPRVGVRSLCAFAARTGDLDHRFTPAPSALAGIEGHTTVTGRPP